MARITGMPPVPSVSFVRKEFSRPPGPTKLVAPALNDVSLARNWASLLAGPSRTLTQPLQKTRNYTQNAAALVTCRPSQNSVAMRSWSHPRVDLHQIRLHGNKARPQSPSLKLQMRKDGLTVNLSHHATATPWRFSQRTRSSGVRIALLRVLHAAKCAATRTSAATVNIVPSSQLYVEVHPKLCLHRHTQFPEQPEHRSLYHCIRCEVSLHGMFKRLFPFSSHWFVWRDSVSAPSSGTLQKHEGRRCEEVELELDEVHDLLLDDGVGDARMRGYVHVDSGRDQKSCFLWQCVHWTLSASSKSSKASTLPGFRMTILASSVMGVHFFIPAGKNSLINSAFLWGLQDLFCQTGH